MLQRNVNKDLRAVSPKIIGPFSVRQSIAVVLGGGLSILLWNIIPGNFAMDMKVGIIALAISPFLAYGWIDYNGLKFEDLIVTTLKSMLLSPPIRKYKSENELGFLFKDVKVEEDKDKKSKDSKTSKKDKKSKKKSNQKPVKEVMDDEEK